MRVWNARVVWNVLYLPFGSSMGASEIQAQQESICKGLPEREKFERSQKTERLTTTA
jgi:hypothetical protein